MIVRNLLYVLTLIAYTLSLAHSVIPHHHHNSPEEATAHHHKLGVDYDLEKTDHSHHRGDHHHADEDHDKSHRSDVGHLFFFTHDLNVDVLTAHKALDNPVKNKKASIATPTSSAIVSFALAKHSVYRPPQNDAMFYDASLYFNSLRGPPALAV